MKKRKKNVSSVIISIIPPDLPSDCVYSPVCWCALLWTKCIHGFQILQVKLEQKTDLNQFAELKPGDDGAQGQSRVFLQCSVFSSSWKSCFVFFFIIDSLAPMSERDGAPQQRSFAKMMWNSMWHTVNSCSTHAGWEADVPVLTLSVPLIRTSSSALCPSRDASAGSVKETASATSATWLQWLMRVINIYSHHMQSGDSWLSDWENQRRWRNARFWFHWTPVRHARV